MNLTVREILELSPSNINKLKFDLLKNNIISKLQNTLNDVELNGVTVETIQQLNEELSINEALEILVGLTEQQTNNTLTRLDGLAS
jgi:hypothetical protein